MNEKKFKELVDERTALKSQEDDIVKSRKALDDKILAEMDARNVKTLTREDGVKITRSTQKRTTYSWTALVAALGSEKKAAKYAHQTVDKDLLAAGIGEGKVAPNVLADIAEVKESSPWVTVSGA